MKNGTKEDYLLLDRHEKKFIKNTADRVLKFMNGLNTTLEGYKISRLQHSLQTATRAFNDKASDEMIVASLLHDIGDELAPLNHAEYAAAVLKPYVSEKTHWIIEKHGIFQMYYYAHHLGGDKAERDDGNFYQPTIFDNVKVDATIAQEEIFGPVTSVFDFEDEEEAINIANSTKYGLASGVFTADDQKAKWTADRIQAGIIWQNDWFVDGTNLPGGGYKRSGYGRDGGVDGIYSHGQTKRISKRLY